MYKINIEQCLKGINNKFELIIKTSNLARKMIIEENLSLVEEKKPALKALKEVEEKSTIQ